MKKLITLITVILSAAAFTLVIGCGKKDDDNKNKKLDMDAECGSFFDSFKKEGGDKDKFIAACKEDSKGGKSYLMCASPDGDSMPYCTGADDAAKKSIEAMKTALGK